MRQIHFLITQKQLYQRERACTREQSGARPPGHQHQQCLHTLLFQFPELVMRELRLWKMIVIHSVLHAGCVCLCARAETAAENKKDELDNLVFSAATSVPWFGCCCRIADPSTSLSALLFLLLAQRKLPLCHGERVRPLLSSQIDGIFVHSPF